MGCGSRTPRSRILSNVTRDFPSDYTTQVDRFLGAIFKNNAAVTGVEFLGMDTPHTATPDDPYWSPQGKAYASIEKAAARGEITPEEAGNAQSLR
jgi:hypothetical protein